MGIPGITFLRKDPSPAFQPGRADIALFAGLVAREPAPLPTALRERLALGGWVPQALPGTGRDPAHVEALLGLPVPVESFEEFARLYRWQERPVTPGAADAMPSNLGLALRSFFAEGGRKAYVVRTGDPLPLVDFGTLDAPVSAAAFSDAKRKLIDGLGKVRLGTATTRIPLLPGYMEAANTAHPSRRETWMGAAAIMGVDDAATLLLPDLIELVAGRAERVADEPDPPAPAEAFKPCAPILPAAEPEPRLARPYYRAPRLDIAGWGEWARAMRHVLDMLAMPRGPSNRRDVMLVGALPLPLASAGLDRGEERNPLLLLDTSGRALPGQMLFDDSLVGSARLQLVYPWLATEASRACPEGIESPEGAFAGLVAQQTLRKGAFHSAAGQDTTTVRDCVPALDSADQRNASDHAEWLGDRLSLFGARHGRMTLLSDATMAASKPWRPGGVSRLMNAILRAAKQMGQDLMFEPNGPPLWARARGEMERFLAGLADAGALTSLSGEPPFEVSCDFTSMTRADIDAGRLIMRIGFTAAYPVERITVSLALLDPGASTSAREAA